MKQPNLLVAGMVAGLALVACGGVALRIWLDQAAISSTSVISAPPNPAQPPVQVALSFPEPPQEPSGWTKISLPTGVLGPGNEADVPLVSGQALVDTSSLTAFLADTVFGPRQMFRPRPVPDGQSAARSLLDWDGSSPLNGMFARKAEPKHRLTILQIGDSHTAADFFTGRVRERLQELYGLGGSGYIVAGRPHAGVRSSLYSSDVSEGWSYEALQKSDERSRFYLSGFNAVARRAGAALNLNLRGALGYDNIEVAFLRQPGGGRAQVTLDGTLSAEIDLDGAKGERAVVSVARSDGDTQPFRNIKVKSLSDQPVTITGVKVDRSGDGISYLSLGFPGATVQLLQKLAMKNLADDLRQMSPDIIVLAFGTNEGFNDALDIANYTSEYEQVLAKLKLLRPDARLVMIGPAEGARSRGGGCGSKPCPVSTSSEDVTGSICRYETPPKLAQVREAQRRIARDHDVMFWDWASIMPKNCGPQIWANAAPALMARDHVHFTLEGYRQSADKFTEALIPLINDTLSPNHAVSYN